jgi:hypothetical protein
MADKVADLHRILLSWNYWELVSKAEEGGGPNDSLRPVAHTFKDIKVRLALSTQLTKMELTTLHHSHSHRACKHTSNCSVLIIISICLVCILVVNACCNKEQIISSSPLQTLF